MVEKKETAAKAKAPKADKAPKAIKAENAPKAEKKAPAQKQAKSGKTITLTQIGSPIGRQGYQRATLIGLGLNKIQRTRTLEDTPSIRGMIAKVKHLVKIAE